MSVGILVLPVLILVALAVGVLIYYICYKAAINRKIRGEESGAHVPMASTETVFKWVMIIGVFVMYMSLSSKITNLRNEIRNVRNDLWNEIDQVQYQLSELEQAAKKEASLFSAVYYDFGAIDNKAHTTEMKFHAVLKNYSKETEVALNYRGKSVTLANNGDGTFTGSEVFPMFVEYYEDGLFCVTEDGVTKTELWEDTVHGELKDYCLPEFYITESSFVFERGKGKNKGTVAVKGNVQLHSKGTDASSFRNLKIIVKKDNEVIDEIAVDSDSITLEQTYPIVQGEMLRLLLTGEDVYGYNHETQLSGWRLDGTSSVTGAEVEYLESQVMISGKSGSVTVTE